MRKTLWLAMAAAGFSLAPASVAAETTKFFTITYHQQDTYWQNSETLMPVVTAISEETACEINNETAVARDVDTPEHPCASGFAIEWAGALSKHDAHADMRLGTIRNKALEYFDIDRTQINFHVPGSKFVACGYDKAINNGSYHCRAVRYSEGDKIEPISETVTCTTAGCANQ